MPFTPRKIDEQIEAESVKFIEKGRGLFRSRKDDDLKETYLADGSMETQKDGSTVTTVSGLRTYFDWYVNDATVYASINNLSEAAVGLGYYNKVEEDEPDFEEAKELCDDFGREQNLDHKNPNVCRIMLTAGFCPVETLITKFPSKSTTKIIHPLTVSKFAQDKFGKLLWLEQKDNEVTKPKRIKADKLTWFVNNQRGNDLRGTSIIKPILGLLGTKQTTIDNIDGIIDRKLYPIGVWKTTRQTGSIKAVIENMVAGEDVIFGNLTPEEIKPGNLVEFINIEGDTKFWEYIDYIDRLIYRGLYAPDLWYWKDATVASARELTAMTDRHIQAIQRNMKRAIEAGYYGRLMDKNKIVTVPRVVWGIETTGVEDLQMENIISTAVEVGLIGPKQLSILLRKMGLDIGELGWDLDEPAEEEEPEEDPEDMDKVPDEEKLTDAIKEVLGANPDAYRGLPGKLGKQGRQGERGSSGSQGETGATGPQGETGSQGEEGPQGPIGKKGKKGDKGDATIQIVDKTPEDPEDVPDEDETEE